MRTLDVNFTRANVILISASAEMTDATSILNNTCRMRYLFTHFKYGKRKELCRDKRNYDGNFSCKFSMPSAWKDYTCEDCKENRHDRRSNVDVFLLVTRVTWQDTINYKHKLTVFNSLTYRTDVDSSLRIIPILQFGNSPCRPEYLLSVPRVTCHYRIVSQ